MNSLRSSLSRAWRAPGRWFWRGVWGGAVRASHWQYRATLRGGIEDYDPTRYGWRDSRLAMRMAREEPPWPYFVRPLPPINIYYRPGAVMWYWAGMRLLGERPTAWRVWALAVEATTATLLALLVAVCAGSRAPALLAAAWFVLYGQHFEVLTWIGTQADLPAAALGLGALAVLWRGRWRWRWRVAASSVLLLMGLLTKETATGILLFAVLSAPLWPVPARARDRALAVGAFAFAAALYLAARHAALGELFAGLKQPGLPPLRANLRAFVHLVWPLASAPQVFASSLSLGWILLLTSSLWRLVWLHLVYYGGAALLFWRAWRPTALFGAWVALTPLPALPLLVMGSRYEYLPSMGWGALGGLLLWQAGGAALALARARFSPSPAAARG